MEELIKQKLEGEKKQVFCSCGELCVYDYEGEITCEKGDKELDYDRFKEWQEKHHHGGNDINLARYELLKELLTR